MSPVQSVTYLSSRAPFGLRVAYASKTRETGSSPVGFMYFKHLNGLKGAALAEPMTLPWLILYLIAALALGGFLWARAQANKPPEIGTIRYIPYTGVMFLAILVLLLCFAYGAELLRVG